MLHDRERESLVSTEYTELLNVPCVDVYLFIYLKVFSCLFQMSELK